MQQIFVCICGLETLGWVAGYTDGPAKLPPHPPVGLIGGYGICMPSTGLEISGYPPVNEQQTNNRGELHAGIELIDHCPSLLNNYWLPRTVIIYALVFRGLCKNGNQGTGAIKKDRYQIQTYGNCCSVHLTIATPRYSGSGYHRMLIYRGMSEQMSWRKLAVSSHRCTVLHQPRMQS